VIDPVVASAHAKGQAGDRNRSDDAVGDILEEPTGDELGMVVHQPRIDECSSGNARHDEFGDGFLERAIGRPCADDLVETIMRGASPGECRETMVGRGHGITQHPGERPPLRIVTDRQRQPSLLSETRVEALRSGMSGPVALTLHDATVRGVLEDGLRGDHERPLDEGDLHQETHTRSFATGERGECRERGVRAPQRITRTAWYERFLVGMTGEVGHATHLFHVLGEADPIGPRAIETERRLADHDRRGVDLVDAFPSEAELRHHPRRVVLDDDIGPFDQLFGKCDALG
jgi:hypothetical protein